MNLWFTRDGHDPFDGGENFLIWAWGSDEAKEVASRFSEYGQPPDAFKTSVEFGHRSRLQPIAGAYERVVVSTRDEPHATRDEPHVEFNLVVMRECGWRDESDELCDECERYTMGLVVHCFECDCCSECCDCGRGGSMSDDYLTELNAAEKRIRELQELLTRLKVENERLREYREPAEALISVLISSIERINGDFDPRIFGSDWRSNAIKAAIADAEEAQVVFIKSINSEEAS